MKKIACAMLSLGLLLASCGANTANTPVPENKDPKVATPSVKNPRKNTSSWALNSPISGKIDKESINKIQTLDDLKKINPNIMQIPGNNHPKFITLQKDQMLLGTYLAELKSPEYIALRQKQASISQAKELWTKELQDLDTELKSISERPITAGSSNSRFQEVLEKKNGVLKDFYSSSTYRQYIQAHTKELEDIDASIKAYWTPEMLELQKTIASLAREVYASGATQ